MRGIIFCTNDFLPGCSRPTRVAGLRREITEQPGARIAIDLERQVVTAPSGTVHHFGIDPFRKQCLLQGVAEIELTPVTATRSRHSSDGRPAN